MPLERQTAANGKCRATTKAGRQCAAPAVRGGIYCALHADPQRAAELGRKGGTRSRKVYALEEQEFAVPTTVGEVKEMLAETMAGVRSGKTDPAIGRTVAYLGTALLRAYEADPPVPVEPIARPTIYTALQYRTARSTGNTETNQQKELQTPGPGLATGPPAPTTEVEVVQHRQEEDFEILDYEPHACRNLGR
jgi:general stress protein YciG